MAFTLPNASAAAFPDQAEPDSVDIDILTAGHSMTGVVSGCAVTAQGVPDMTVAVAAGTISSVGVNQAVTGGNVTVPAAHATLPRKDLVVVSNTGVKSLTNGTAGAQPLKPAIPSNSVALAEVYVPAADTAINTNQITDKRVIVQAATSTLMRLLARKTSDQSVTSSTVLVNDNTLAQAVTANSVWRFEWHVHAEGAGGDIAIGWAFPSGGRLGFSCVCNSAAGAVTDWAVSTATTPTGVMLTHGLNNTPNWMPTIIDATFVNGATAGTVNLMWAQNTSNATSVTVKTNSQLWGAQIV